MKSIHITSSLIWTILLFFNGALSSYSYTSQNLRNRKTYVNFLSNNGMSVSSKSSKLLSSSSTRNKRQVELRINGIQHIYESPRRGYESQNLLGNQEQINLRSSYSNEAVPSDSNMMAPTISQNPEVNLKATVSKSFSGNMIDNMDQRQPLLQSTSPMEDENSHITDEDVNHGSRDLRSGDLFNKPEVLNTPQTHEDNFHNTQTIDNESNKDPNIEPSLTNTEMEHFDNGSPLSSPLKGNALISAFQTQRTNLEDIRDEHFRTDPTLRNFQNYPPDSPSNMMEVHMTRSSLDHLHTTDPRTNGIATHEFIHTSQGERPPFDTPHIEPVIHPDSGPQIINALGPDNVHVIKKFYPLPVVQKVPRPVPMVERRPFPYPVHQHVHRFVPQPFPQPFSKPDVHLSYIHLENRGK